MMTSRLIQRRWREADVEPGPIDTPIDGWPEMAWRLVRDAWGHGLGLKAACSCRDKAWEQGVPRLFAITVTANVRSRRLMERLGLRRIAAGDFDHATLPPGDPLRHHVLYAIDRPVYDVEDRTWMMSRL